MRKPTFCMYVCENKDADQLHSDRPADQYLCFGYKDRTLYFLNPKLQASSHHLWLYSSVVSELVGKNRRQVFSQRCSIEGVLSFFGIQIIICGQNKIAQVDQALRDIKVVCFVVLLLI